MAKLNEVADELNRIWPYYSTQELCEYYKICSNTLWHWKTKLGLPNKKVGRPDVEVKFQGNNYGLSKGDNIIYMKDKIIFGKIECFNLSGTLAVVKTEDGQCIDLETKLCKKEF